MFYSSTVIIDQCLWHVKVWTTSLRGYCNLVASLNSGPIVQSFLKLSLWDHIFSRVNVNKQWFKLTNLFFVYDSCLLLTLGWVSRTLAILDSAAANRFPVKWNSHNSDLPCLFFSAIRIIKILLYLSSRFLYHNLAQVYSSILNKASYLLKANLHSTYFLTHVCPDLAELHAVILSVIYVSGLSR